MATRALSPLRRFISTVQSISAGEMTARVPLTGTKDELYLLSELFNEMLDRVSALIRGMRDSLDHVAHDIRTPLTRLRASVEMALVSEKYEVQHDALLTCYEESERIQNMLRLLLDITAAETGVLKLNLEKVDVVAFLDDLMDFFQMFVDEKKQQFVLERSEVKEWTFDRGLVFQTLVNVLENAFKYTPVEGRIVLRVFEKNSELCFEVEDNGIGILDIDMPRIFDRLFRGNLSRSEKGMGLGLSLVKAFVGAHKGEVRVKSEPEKGSVFTVSLPSF